MIDEAKREQIRKEEKLSYINEGGRFFVQFLLYFGLSLVVYYFFDYEITLIFLVTSGVSFILEKISYIGKLNGLITEEYTQRSCLILDDIRRDIRQGLAGNTREYEVLYGDKSK